MIQKALEYLNAKFLDASTPIDAHGCMYSPVDLRLIKAPEAVPLTLHTLQGIVDYVDARPDEVDNGLVHVLQPDHVKLIMHLSYGTRQRETILEVKLLQIEFPFGRYISQEEFIVGVQSQFVQTPERDALLKVAGSITSEAIHVSEDDGITQRATVKVGIARQATVDLPNPVKLRPFRTFTEVDQPEGLFVFRMMPGAKLALFEADGGGWRNQAIKNIAFWLTGALKDKGMAIVA